MKRFAAVLLLAVLIAASAAAEQTWPAGTPEELFALWYHAAAKMRESEIYPYVELRRGDTGYEVLSLQARLARLNYYGKEIDPHYGSGTEAAMRMFEKVNGLKINGVASAEDQKLLFTDRALPNPGTAIGLRKGQTPEPGNWLWPQEPPAWWTSSEWPPAVPGPSAQEEIEILPGLPIPPPLDAEEIEIGAGTPAPEPLVPEETEIEIGADPTPEPASSEGLPFSTGLLFFTATPAPVVEEEIPILP